MTIKKYLHSCILLEDKGKRLLIDPGSFSFFEKRIVPQDIGYVDAILITHSHPDHYFPEALKVFVDMGCKRIVASEEICELLKKENLPAEVIAKGETKEIADFEVLAIEASHGDLPIPIPHHFAYLVNKKFLDAGDSITVNIPTGMKVEILALPTFAPWEKTIESLDFAKKIKPKVAIPIHDWIIKEMPLERFYTFMYKPILEREGIIFNDLKLGEQYEA